MTTTIKGFVMFDLYEVERAVVREEEFVCTVGTGEGFWKVYMDEDKNFYGFYVDSDEVEEWL